MKNMYDIFPNLRLQLWAVHVELSSDKCANRCGDGRICVTAHPKLWCSGLYRFTHLTWEVPLVTRVGPGHDANASGTYERCHHDIATIVDACNAIISSVSILS